ncbi:MAG: hypothetical protein LBC51_02505 [Treponema sp.]|jgi:hypothetical protein|nr:hypothetical protein [Treponema sp.]
MTINLVNTSFTALAKEAVNAAATKVEIMLIRTPTAACNKVISITIPASVLSPILFRVAGLLR